MFCKRGGGGCTVDSSEASGLLSLMFFSNRDADGDKNTVAISIGPRFTVVPDKNIDKIKFKKNGKTT